MASTASPTQGAATTTAAPTGGAEAAKEDNTGKEKKGDQGREKGEDKKAEEKQEYPVPSLLSLQRKGAVSGLKWLLVAASFIVGVRVCGSMVQEELEQSCVARLETIREISEMEGDNELKLWTRFGHSFMLTTAAVLLEREAKLRFLGALVQALREVGEDTHGKLQAHVEHMRQYQEAMERGEMVQPPEELQQLEQELQNTLPDHLTRVLFFVLYFSPGDSMLLGLFVDRHLNSLLRTYPWLVGGETRTLNSGWWVAELSETFLACDTRQLLDSHPERRTQLMHDLGTLLNSIASDPESSTHLLSVLARVFDRVGVSVVDGDGEGEGRAVPPSHRERQMFLACAHNVIAVSMLYLKTFVRGDQDLDPAAAHHAARAVEAAAHAADRLGMRLKCEETLEMTAQLRAEPVLALPLHPSLMSYALRDADGSLLVCGATAFAYGAARSAFQQWRGRRRALKKEGLTLLKRRVWLRGGLCASAGMLALMALSTVSIDDESSPGLGGPEANFMNSNSVHRARCYSEHLFCLWFARYAMIAFPFSLGGFVCGQATWNALLYASALVDEEETLGK